MCTTSLAVHVGAGDLKSGPRSCSLYPPSLFPGPENSLSSRQRSQKDWQERQIQRGMGGQAEQKVKDTSLEWPGDLLLNYSSTQMSLLCNLGQASKRGKVTEARLILVGAVSSRGRLSLLALAFFLSPELLKC